MKTIGQPGPTAYVPALPAPTHWVRERHSRPRQWGNWSVMTEPGSDAGMPSTKCELTIRWGERVPHLKPAFAPSSDRTETR